MPITLPGAIPGIKIAEPAFTFDPMVNITVEQPQTPIHVIGGRNGFVDDVPGYVSSARKISIDIDASRFIGCQNNTQTHAMLDSAVSSSVNHTIAQHGVSFMSGDEVTLNVTSGVGTSFSSPVTFSGTEWATGTGTTAITGGNITVTGGDQFITLSGVGTGVTTSGYAYSSKDSIEQQIKRFMKSNLLIKRGRSRRVESKLSPSEIKARRTLRDLISERAYHRYLTNGFVMIGGQSGLHYQIFSDARHTKLYSSGKYVGEICIHTDKKCPPTDHIINIKMLIELDEIEVWKGGNLRNLQKGFQIPFELSKRIDSYAGLNGATAVEGNVIQAMTDQLNDALTAGAYTNIYNTDTTEITTAWSNALSEVAEPKNLVEAYKQAKAMFPAVA